MKMAVLIQCHNKSEQVNQLIDFFNEDWVDLYIHIDSKSSIIDELKLQDNVKLIKNRIDVNWGTFSQCEATLKLFKEVFDSNINYKYIHLISGEDYPIKSLDEFYQFFSKQNCNFIEFTKLPNNDLVKSGIDRYEVYYPVWMIDRPNRILLRLIRVVYRNFILYTKIFKRNQKLFETIYYGSSWFTINYPTFKYVMEYIENNQSAVKFFENSIYSDEMFFHTIILNSEHQLNTKNYNLRYIDWSEKQGSPKVVNEDDVELAMLTNSFFIRKVQSINVINYINSKL